MVLGLATGAPLMLSVRVIWNMELDNEKIDDTVLALLLLGLHDGARAWKEFDWGAMNRLHEKGLISDPHGKARSVVLTEDGLRRAERLLEELFLSQKETANQRYEHVYAIVRHDRFQEPSEQSFTVKEVVRTQAMAEAEVNQVLTHLAVKEKVSAST